MASSRPFVADYWETHRRRLSLLLGPIGYTWIALGVAAIILAQGEPRWVQIVAIAPVLLVCLPVVLIGLGAAWLASYVARDVLHGLGDGAAALERVLRRFFAWAL